MPEDKRPFVMNGKAGMKKDGEIIIPAEYDYIKRKFGKTVFYAVKDGRGMYLNDKGQEVLTRVRRFEGENTKYSPFWLCSNEFDYVTAMEYIGFPVEGNPNVVKINDDWIELERYSKEEIMGMLIDPADDLPVTKENLELLCNHFSYEYSFYFANANGLKPLTACMEQFKKMDAFYNSWYYIIKLWQAPGEHVTAKELRRFDNELRKHKVLGNPIYAIGHDESLNPGEVRMLMVTHYHERCWPEGFEYEWARKLRSLPVTQLMKDVPELRKEIDDSILECYQDEVFHDQLLECINGLNYYKDLSWEDAREALEYFFGLGSPIKRALLNYVRHAQACNKAQTKKAEFYLNAALWALKKGDDINACTKKSSVLDIVTNIQKKNLSETANSLSASLAEALKAKGGRTFKDMYEEHKNNSDYFKELEYMKINGTSDKVMPGLC